jgi:hypothetical protein
MKLRYYWIIPVEIYILSMITLMILWMSFWHQLPTIPLLHNIFDTLTLTWFLFDIKEQPINEAYILYLTIKKRVVTGWNHSWHAVSNWKMSRFKKNYHYATKYYLLWMYLVKINGRKIKCLWKFSRQDWWTIFFIWQLYEN